jgi:hypothetical protein
MTTVTTDSKLKHNLKYGLRKVLETIDKGLAQVQKHPVAFERTVLVVTTVFVTRSAYKKFSPANVVHVTVPPLKGGDYTSNVVNGYQTPTGAPIEILRTITPGPYDDIADASYVAHLEVTDNDLYDMKVGNLLGMVFNVKNIVGEKNTPLAVMRYEDFMDHVKPGFPIHESAEKLLAQN